MEKMIELSEIIELFEEIENGCEYGALGVFVVEDGSYWFCNRDVEVLSKQIVFRAANVQMQDALAESLLSTEDKFLSDVDTELKEYRMDFLEPSQVKIESLNDDYYGTREEIINEVMAGAFDAPFGSDFSL